ncbi:hypothetical protein ACE8FZ_06715 [Peribacillus frigoritolerans]|uniref:hypothetical protein n=1 Tax=Peribacillus frigoritolerans TaxID=450367 RepID=UPI0035CF84A5
MKFETYEKFLAEQQSKAEKGGQLQNKKDDAQAKLNELLAEYETTMARKFTKGTNEDKALDELDTKIDAAKRERDRAAREYEVYGRVSRDISITREDVIAAWNSKVNPEHYDNKIAPALKTLESAKKAYYEAMCVYFDSVHEIKDFREEVSGTLGYDFPFHFHIKDIVTNDEHNRYFIRQEEIDKAQSRNR